MCSSNDHSHVDSKCRPMSYTFYSTQYSYCAASICMQIMPRWSNALTITYFFSKVKESPHLFWLPSQLTNYPENVVQSVSKQRQHCTFESHFSYCVFFFFWVTTRTESPWPRDYLVCRCQITKLIIKQKLCLSVCVCVSAIACGFAS